eukprot:scaffold2725_cov119-Isochrysis_galbana.AAC.7
MKLSGRWLRNSHSTTGARRKEGRQACHRANPGRRRADARGCGEQLARRNHPKARTTASHLQARTPSWRGRAGTLGDVVDEDLRMRHAAVCAAATARRWGRGPPLHQPHRDRDLDAWCGRRVGLTLDDRAN